MLKRWAGVIVQKIIVTAQVKILTFPPWFTPKIPTNSNI